MPTDPTPRRYRKRPVVIEAIRYDGGFPLRFLGDDQQRVVSAGDDTGALLIFTLEGTMRAEVGDYIIRGVKGELYPCKPDIFLTTYEDAALAATGDAPLSETERDRLLMEWRREWGVNPMMIEERAFNEGLDAAYTTLAAQLAAARAERDALRERVRRITEPYLALLLDHDSRKWIAPQIWFAVEQAVKGTPARPTDTGRDG